MEQFAGVSAMSSDETPAGDPAAEPPGAQPRDVSDPSAPSSQEQSTSIPSIMADPARVFTDRSSTEGHSPRKSILKLFAELSQRTATAGASTGQPDAPQTSYRGPGEAKGSDKEAD